MSYLYPLEDLPYVPFTYDNKLKVLIFSYTRYMTRDFRCYICFEFLRIKPLRPETQPFVVTTL